MKRVITIFFLTLLTCQVLSQSHLNSKILGRVQDEVSNSWLSGASITCLKSEDSSKLSLQFTDKNGYFSFDSLPSDSYLLYITYMGYQPLTHEFKVQLSASIIDIGTLKMKRSTLNLTEIEIKGKRPPIRIAKDTIEFSAGYIQIKQNASVEDLLRRVPGIQIDNNGILRINGEIVNTIMVDGQSLFGDDPSIVSKNLQADLIDKIQLIDKPGDQLRSSILNGYSKGKIINITIKKDKYNLLSGELNMATGTSDRSILKANLSQFKEKKQLLIIGSWNNTAGITDISSFSNGGKQQTLNGGISYHNKMNNKTSFNINYQVTGIKINDQLKSTRENIFKDSSSVSNKESTSLKNNNNQNISTQLEYKIDSSQIIIFFNQFTLSKITNDLQSDYTSIGSRSQILNNGTINNHDNNRTLALSNGIRYEKRFKNKNRVLSVLLNYSQGSGNGIQFISSTSSYFPPNIHQITDTTNQYVTNNSLSRQSFIMLTYTEPVFEYGRISISLAENKVKDSYKKAVYDYNSNTKEYDKINDSLSTNYDSSPKQHFIKLKWQYQKKTFEYTLSLAAPLYRLNCQSSIPNSNISIKFNVILPEASFAYNLAENKWLKFLYKKNVQFPQISELQSTRDNSDPLNIIYGNIALKPMITHNFDIGYTSTNAKSMRTFSLLVNSKIIKSQIINSSLIDTLGRQITTPINLNGGYNLNVNMNNYFPLGAQTNSFNLETKFSFDRLPSYSNGTNLISDLLSASQSLNYTYIHRNLYDITILGGMDYNQIKYHNSSLKRISYLNYNIGLSGSINFPYGFTININLIKGWSNGRAAGYNANGLMLNASISKMLFKQKQAVISLQGFDLLEENTNMRRIVKDSYIEDTKTNTLSRFFLLKFSYYLGKRNK